MIEDMAFPNLSGRCSTIPFGTVAGLLFPFTTGCIDLYIICNNLY